MIIDISSNVFTKVRILAWSNDQAQSIFLQLLSCVDTVIVHFCHQILGRHIKHDCQVTCFADIGHFMLVFKFHPKSPECLGSLLVIWPSKAYPRVVSKAWQIMLLTLSRVFARLYKEAITCAYS